MKFISSHTLADFIADLFICQASSDSCAEAAPLPPEGLPNYRAGTVFHTLSVSPSPNTKALVTVIHIHAGALRGKKPVDSWKSNCVS